MDPSEGFVVKQGEAGGLEELAHGAVVGPGARVFGFDAAIVIPQHSHAGGAAGEGAEGALVAARVQEDGAGDEVAGEHDKVRLVPESEFKGALDELQRDHVGMVEIREVERAPAGPKNGIFQWVTSSHRGSIQRAYPAASAPPRARPEAPRKRRRV